MPPSIRDSAFADLATVATTPTAAPASGSRGGLHDRASRRPSSVIGFTCAAIVLGAALFGPALAPHDPFAITGGSLVAPSAAHPMGTDALGRDLLSGVLHGARTSLLVAGPVSVIALVIGTVIGMLAGYRVGLVDDALMRTTELFLAIPRFFFVVATIALFGPGIDSTVLVLGLTSWPTIARVVRGEVLAIRQLDYVRASEAMGATAWHVIRYQLLPGVRPALAVTVGLLFGQVLLLEATLGFLGLGDPGAVSLGMLAAQAGGFLRVAWWLALFPGLAITLAVLGVNLLADAFGATRAP